MENRFEDVTQAEEKKKVPKKKLVRLLLTIILSLVVLVFYRVSLNFSFFPIVMWAYMIFLTVLVVVYIFYNRGFYEKRITVDMLPEDWEEERKIKFVEQAAERERKSKWMLMLIIAFLVTFLVDALELFVFGTLFK